MHLEQTQRFLTGIVATTWLPRKKDERETSRKKRVTRDDTHKHTHTPTQTHTREDTHTQTHTIDE